MNWKIGDFVIYNRPESSPYNGHIVRIKSGVPSGNWFVVGFSSYSVSCDIYVYKEHLKPLTKLHKALL